MISPVLGLLETPVGGDILAGPPQFHDPRSRVQDIQ
jgi:hypothetical protein